jgi:hypothetical protein
MLTPPVVGRISIGRTVERQGRRLPEKDDEFTLTTQVQTRGGWALHPLDGVLRGELQERALMATGIEVKELPGTPDAKPRARKKEPGQPGTTPSSPPMGAAHTKLRSIPVRLLFNDPGLNLRASYTLFDRATARPLCVGDGQHCKRVTHTGVESLPCPAPDHCALGIEGGCKLFGRFNVRIDHAANQGDALSTFVLRTTSVNTVRTLMARMRYLHALSGGLLAFLPLELRLRGKSTAQSHRAPIYYVDLGLRAQMPLGLAVLQAREEREQARAGGLDLEALERAAREGYAQGLFEETGEDASAVVQEFYGQGRDTQAGARMEQGEQGEQGGSAPQIPGEPQRSELAARLEERMRRAQIPPPASPPEGECHG